MGSNKTSKKTKKPIETTLGKCRKETGEDDSHLRRPIETSVNGIKHIVALWESATLEVKDLLSFECDIMYECRVCRSIFRSLANFLLHKRNYCTDKFLVSHQLYNNNLFELNVNSTSTENNSGLQPLEKVVQKLHEVGLVRQCAEQLSTVDLSNQDPLKNMKELEVRLYEPSKAVIENIDSNSTAVFQTILNGPTDPNIKREEFMKTEVMEIHKKLQNDVPVLDAEGKICALTSHKLLPSIYPKSDLKCTECNNQFATQKSLTTHMKLVHNPSRTLYVCPTCKETFANPWCVYRHLLKVHRLTNKQVRRMREQVHNNWVRRDEIAVVPKKQENEAVEDRENQWINDIEGDNDFQYCIGCGKHFERKAALHSHSQMCAKRLEVCNNIKENAKKKEESIEKAKLEKATADDKTVKGASKRKGRIICTYRREQQRDHVLSPSISVDEAICLSSDEACKSPLIPADKEDQANFPKTTKCSVVLENFNKLDPEYLLTNDVSFETFCKSVESIKRETDTPIKIEHCDTDDDVIFVSENSPASLSNSPPLEFNTKQECKRLKRKKIMSKSVATKRAPKSELDLLSRASAYLDRTKLRCIPCGRSFHSFKILLYHMAAHFSWFRFQCAKCTFVTYSKFDCITHCRKQHKMTENLVLPIPAWKSIFMSHDFRLLKDFRKLRGRHTDENITSEDSEQFHTENCLEDTVQESCVLFEENLVDVKEEKDLQLDPETLISGIDVQEPKDDLTILAEPLELAMPADVHVSEMLTLNEDVDLDKPTERVSACAVDESNDDWGLSKVCSEHVPEEETLKTKTVINIRPARIRNKAKKDDNFLYYDNSTRSLVPF